MSTFKILENTIDITEGFTLLINSAVNQLDGFGVTDESPLLLESDLIRNCIKNLRINGKRVRYITDIKNSNLDSCQRIMQLVELRHLDNIQGNVMIFADKVRLKNAIENLITNAIDAPNSNNIQISIDCENTTYGYINNEDLNLAFVGIVDVGEGIDRLLLPILFSKFVTNSRSGLRLGL